MSEVVTGSCHCGAVAFAIGLPTQMCGHCHCDSCRRIHASAFVTWTSVPESRFQWVRGEGTTVAYPSSPGVTRRFCGRCGTPVKYESADLAGRAYVPVACLEGPLDRSPECHVNFARKVPWVECADALPKHEAFD